MRGVTGRIICVARDETHRFSKVPQARVRLIAGIGVEGDAHAGETMKHRSRLGKTKVAPNIRQVHLLQSELFEEMANKGFAVEPAQMGENVTTQGIDLLGLPRGARLRLGSDALVEITGLRNPCWQIDANIGQGAMAATLDRGPRRKLIRKSGVMAVVLEGGEVAPGDRIEIAALPDERLPLEPV